MVSSIEGFWARMAFVFGRANGIRPYGRAGRVGDYEGGDAERPARWPRLSARGAHPSNIMKSWKSVSVGV